MGLSSTRSSILGLNGEVGDRNLDVEDLGSVLEE